MQIPLIELINNEYLCISKVIQITNSKISDAQFEPGSSASTSGAGAGDYWFETPGKFYYVNLALSCLYTTNSKYNIEIGYGGTWEILYTR